LRLGNNIHVKTISLIVPLPPTPKAMILTYLILYYVRKLSCKFELFWLSGFWKENHMILPYFSIFVITYLPFEGNLTLYLNKLEFPSPKGELYQLWLKKDFFFKFSIFFYSFAIISPLLHFIWTNVYPFPQWWLVPSSVKIGTVVLEKKWKMWKQTDGQTHDGHWASGHFRNRGLQRADCRRFNRGVMLKHFLKLDGIFSKNEFAFKKLKYVLFIFRF
jgi:hypothetical protein